MLIDLAASWTLDISLWPILCGDTHCNSIYSQRKYLTREQIVSPNEHMLIQRSIIGQSAQCVQTSIFFMKSWSRTPTGCGELMMLHFAACYVILSIVCIFICVHNTESKAQLYDPSWNTDQGVQLDCESSSILLYSVAVSIIIFYCCMHVRGETKVILYYLLFSVNWTCYHAYSATQADYVYALEFISGVYDYI